MSGKWNEFERSAKKKLIAWGLLAAAAGCALVAIWTESWQWCASGAVLAGVAVVISVAAS